MSVAHAQPPLYRRGAHELGPGLFAYVQPSGTWGWSNAGLVTSQGQSLLIDTLFDLRLTRRMLDELARVAPAAARIDTVVNTHANGDHCFGNQLVAGAEIIASAASAAEMAELPPKRVAQLVALARLLRRGGRPVRRAAGWLGRLGVQPVADLAEAAEFVDRIFGPFDFCGIDLVAPTRTFTGELELQVGDKQVLLIEVGPAHTAGDVLVHVPGDRTVFTGDIVFAGTHPIVWAGPVANWVRACDRILAMDVDTVVPGHGPVTDKAGVVRLKSYLEYVDREGRKRFTAGMSAEHAARDIALDAYADWLDAERIAVNVATVYRDLQPSRPAAGPIALFARMARLVRRRTGAPPIEVRVRKSPVQ
jgi:cyclase